MSTIEYSIEQWAALKRQDLSMSEQESVRIWNTVLSTLEQGRVPVVVGESPRSTDWKQTLMRWSIIPVAAMALLVITTTVEKSSDVPTSPQPLPVVLNDRKNDGAALNVVDVKNSDAPNKNVRTVVFKRRVLVAKRELYASRDQSVFAAWGESVFSPQQASTHSGQVFGTSVFSEL